jgi:hypothetical protein
MPSHNFLVGGGTQIFGALTSSKLLLFRKNRFYIIGGFRGKSRVGRESRF